MEFLVGALGVSDVVLLVTASSGAASTKSPGQADRASVVLGHLDVIGSNHGADGRVVAASESVLEGGVDVGVQDRSGPRGVADGSSSRGSGAGLRRASLDPTSVLVV